MSTLGLVAGSGILPRIIAESVSKRRADEAKSQPEMLEVVAACHRGETDPELERLVRSAVWVKAGKLGAIIRFFETQGVTSVVFAGGLRRPNLLRGFWPDLTALSVIRRAGGVRDDLLLREIAREFERHGMQVLAPQIVLPELLTPAGFHVGSLTTEQRVDARLGWDAAEMLGSLDVGQTAIAHRGMIVALEGIEGTDACIRRAGQLCGSGFTVVKRSKPQQDQRLDLPTIGEGTIDTLIEAKAGALIVHSGASLLLNPVAVERKASAAGLRVVAVSGRDELFEGAACASH